jgi:Na+-translocating ferredoxin:NAD+ oxidoreductase RnfD subunit
MPLIKQDGIYRTYAAIYVVSAISALLFLVSRRLITIVISFAVVGICFVMLIQSNLLSSQTQGKTLWKITSSNTLDTTQPSGNATKPNNPNQEAQTHQKRSGIIL